MENRTCGQLSYLHLPIPLFSLENLHKKWRPQIPHLHQELPIGLLNRFLLLLYSSGIVSLPTITTLENLSPLPPIPIQPVGPAYAVIGYKIYIIGGSINDIPSTSVWILDCRVNKWETGPKMKVRREFAAATTVNDKIYVMGGCSLSI